jgi:arginine repressor
MMGDILVTETLGDLRVGDSIELLGRLVIVEDIRESALHADRLIIRFYSDEIVGTLAGPETLPVTVERMS